MPKPTEGESQKDFVSRCIPIVLKEGTAKDNKQAAAICYSMYREHKQDDYQTNKVSGDYPLPEPDEDHAGFLQRCITTRISRGPTGLNQVEIKKLCQTIWEEHGREDILPEEPGGPTGGGREDAEPHKSIVYQLIEPRPVKGETIDQWLIRCPPIFEADGQSPVQARGRCCIIWDEWVGEPDYPEQPRKPEQPGGPPSDDQNPKYSGEGTRQLYTFDMDCDHAIEYIIENPEEYQTDTTNVYKYNAVALIGDKFYKKKFLGFKETELARQTMDGSYHDINHYGTSYPLDGHPNIEYIIGHQENTKTDLKTKRLITDIIIDPTAKHYDTWRGFMNICKSAGRTANVSVSFWADNKTMKARDLPPGTNYNFEGYKEDSDVPVLTNLSFQALSTVFKGACDDKQGCGIGLQNDNMKTKRKEFELKKGIEEQEFRLKNRGKEENNG